MSKNLENKKQVVADILEKFQKAQSVVIVHYSGITVENVTALRNQFRENGVEYCVLKNTLVRRALQAALPRSPAGPFGGLPQGAYFQPGLRFGSAAQEAGWRGIIAA